MSGFLEKNLALMPGEVAAVLREAADSAAAELSGGRTSWRIGEARGEFPHGRTEGFATAAEDKHLYVFYGFGDGEYLERFLKSPEVREALVFEPNAALLRAVLASRDLTGLLADPRLGWIVGGDAEGYVAAIERYFDARAVRYYYSGFHGNLVPPGGGGVPGHREGCLKFAEAFRIAVGNVTAKIRSRPAEDNFRGLVNTLDNFLSLSGAPWLEGLSGLCAGIPGVLVGSGPSLQHALPRLKGVEGRAVVFACDSTLKTLLANGVTPHFTGCLERMRQNARFFAGLPADLPAALVVPPVVHPDVLGNYPGARILAGRIIGFEKWLFPELVRRDLGTMVSHLGLEILAELGCREIYAVGLDGAYSPDDGTTYGKSAPEGLRQVGETSRGMMRDMVFDLPGHDGTPKKTNYYWHEASGVYSAMIARRGLDFLNVMPERYGIPIAGARRVGPDALSALPARELPDISGALARVSRGARERFGGDAAAVDRGRAYLERVVAFCLDKQLSITRVLLERHPEFSADLSEYRGIFAGIEKDRLALMADPEGLFEAILVPLVLNDHALMEFELRAANASGRAPARIVADKFDLYLRWYRDVAHWAQRAAHAIGRRAGSGG